MNKDAQGRWKVGMSNIKLKMRVNKSSLVTHPTPGFARRLKMGSFLGAMRVVTPLTPGQVTHIVRVRQGPQDSRVQLLKFFEFVALEAILRNGSSFDRPSTSHDDMAHVAGSCRWVNSVAFPVLWSTGLLRNTDDEETQLVLASRSKQG
jgi:hypothetical protein